MILGIETSSKNCSLALWEGEVLLGSFDRVSEDFLHAEILHEEMNRLLMHAGVSFSALKGVAVGSGPGSYTGLRIGVSAAKGLALALQIPLYAISGLKMMLSQSTIESEKEVLVVMDARRNEVFGAWRRKSGLLDDPTAIIVDDDFIATHAHHTLVILGENASKLRALLPQETTLIDALPSVKSICMKGLDLGEPVDLAYFEPVYVKPFVPTVSKK